MRARLGTAARFAGQGRDISIQNVRPFPEIRARVSALVLGGVPREQKMLKGHLSRVIYHQVYQYTKVTGPL